MGPLRTRVLGRGTSVSFSCDPLVLYIASCVWGLQPRLVWALPIKGPIKGTIVGLSPIQSLLTGCRGHTQHSALSCLIAPGTRRVLRPAASDDAAAEPFAGAGHHGRHVRVRRPSGGDGQVLGREPTRAGRVRARVPRHGGRAGGGHQEAAGRRRAGRPRVPRRGGDHQPRAPQEPRLPRRLLPLRRAAAARVRGQGVAGRRWTGRGGGGSRLAPRRASRTCTKTVIQRSSIVTSKRRTSFWITITSQRLQISGWPNTKQLKSPLFLRV
ncbi:Putative prolin-rich extensin-like receptor protein kinase family protein [Zea mays]|uniref:Putative prolin-rich extensin-like receptor protein kinase family protein n=1 Tax=Zea mays TaxID=4577 RepID=B7ZZV2_MAIZE|nr:unknown [Zea mays]AQL00466.1 Putative prolin-rich extensin-like receptor protein kinase family protein [Zea mays]|eukprot:NP_001146197.1 uncharacterized protein LOC100279767 [Zea mays]